MTVVTGSVVSHMMDGKDAITGVAQKYTVTIAGTFEVGDRFTITLGSNDARSRYGAGGNPVPPGVFALAYKSKVYVISGSILYFSGVDAPLKWNTLDTGAGSIYMANQAAGAEVLVSLATYFDRLAVFSRRAVQIWFVDADESTNTQLQILNNTGTVAAESVKSFGDTDVFYLSDSGVRSLRARDSSNSAHVSDVGSAIDEIIVPHMQSLTAAQVKAAVSAVEPVDGRFWLAIKDTIYVFSFFPASKISAWSTYKPGFDVDEMVTQNDAIYIRGDNTVYLYGGDNSTTYESTTVTVEIPFLDADDPAALKSWTGVDAAIEGTWTVKLGLDPADQTDLETIAVLTRTTFPDQRVSTAGRSSHGSLQFVSTADGAAKISTIAMHYAKDDSG